MPAKKLPVIASRDHDGTRILEGCMRATDAQQPDRASRLRLISNCVPNGTELTAYQGLRVCVLVAELGLYQGMVETFSRVVGASSIL